MPHIIVKLYPGRSEEQKQRLADRIASDVVEIFGCGEDVVSIGFEEVGADDWDAKVYQPDIVSPPGKLYKKPGYSM